MRFSIIIPVLRGKRDPSEVLCGLHTCLSQKEYFGNMEIHLISNLPDPQLERRFAELRSAAPLFFHCSGKRGVNAAKNVGIRASRGELLFFLDDDCLLPPMNFLAKVDRLFRSNPTVDVFGGCYQSLPDANWRARGYNAMSKAWMASRRT